MGPVSMRTEYLICSVRFLTLGLAAEFVTRRMKAESRTIAARTGKALRPAHSKAPGCQDKTGNNVLPTVLGTEGAASSSRLRKELVW